MQPELRRKTERHPENVKVRHKFNAKRSELFTMINQLLLSQPSLGTGKITNRSDLTRFI
jgi:hypothetical protein